MARKQNNSSDQEKDSAREMNKTSAPVDERAIEDKLRDAAGNISKAADDSKLRDDELAKRRKEEAKAKRAEAAEAEKQRRAAEKELRKQTEARLAELEYAESYRKKLQKEKKKADEERKLREKEAQEAERKAVEEATAKRIAEILEAERNDARRRSERAEALLSRVKKLNSPEEDGDGTARNDGGSEQPESANAAPDVPAQPEEAEAEIGDAPDGDDVSDAEVPEKDDAPEAEKAFAEDGASEEKDTPDEELEEDAYDTITVTFGEDSYEDTPVDIIYSDSSDPDDVDESAEEAPEDFDDDFDGDVLGDVARWFSKTKSAEEKGETEKPAAEKSDEKSDEETEEDEDDVDPLDEIPSSNSGRRASFDNPPDGSSEDYRKIPRRKKNRDDLPITDEVLEQSDIVKEIRAQGKKLRPTRLSLKNYTENSRKAIRDFTKALKEGRRALEANRDERRTPEIFVNLLKISAKIIEIRCDNLENYARLKATAYIKDARVSLRRDINEYNELAVSFSALTGEQLTRFSTLLPDSIAERKALAVIPALGYKESYVQVYPDAEGQIPNEDGSVLTPVLPTETADTVLEKYDAKLSPFGIAGYIRQTKKAIKILCRHTDRITKNLSGATEAERKYKSILRSLERETPKDEQDSDEYRRAVLKVRFKYGKRITSIKTSRVKYAFAKTKARMLVECLSIEREKLAVARRLLREAYNDGKSSYKEKAEAIFMEAVASYNRYARQCQKNTGVKFDTLPSDILGKVRKDGGEYAFPIIAYKRELIETVGTASRAVSMALKESIEANENAYTESSRMVLSGARGMRDRVSLTDEAPMVDRASSIAKVVIDTLREYADAVGTADEFDLYMEKSERAVKFFRKSLKKTERAISKAFDENGVVAALVENLRVISNMIEVRRINIALAARIKRPEYARAEGRALYKDIELYNGRAIDYMSIVGEQFTRITTAPINVLAESADKLRIPQISYKDNYIEVFPKDPLEEPLHEKATQRRGGHYTPLLMKHFRLTENRAVETTVVNSPFIFDISIDNMPIVSWWHPTTVFGRVLGVIFQPIIAASMRYRANSGIWFIKTSLELSKSGLDARGEKSEARRKKLEARLARLEKERNQKLLALSTSVHDSDRNTAAYHKRLNEINFKYSNKICRLKLRWMQECPAQTETRQMLERLVLDRELLIGVNKLLIKYRNYGRITFAKNIIQDFKKRFLEAINEHNETARKLSKLVGVEFSEVSTTVADEIIRYGNMVRFPQIVCCREIVESVGGSERSVGDKWHGYGFYNQNPGGTPSGAPPVMSVGAMGYSTEMGIPYFNADFSSMSMIGLTPKGVPLIGFSNSGEAAIPFSGIPMMMKGEDDSPVLDAGVVGRSGPLIGGVNAADPYSSINSGAIDSIYVDNIEARAKNGVTVETPIDVESAMVEERFLRSLNARAMTTVDSVRTWWKLIGSEINLMIQRNLFLSRSGFLRILLPDDDEFLENVSTLVPKEEKEKLVLISKLSSIISIETSRLYSATKAGIRRSQRRFSAWLHRDIELYNRLVKEYNALPTNPNHSEPRRENEKLRPLSYSIPDKIRHRLEDRPVNPPKFKFRNRVRTAPFGWSQETPTDAKKKNKSQRVSAPVDTDNMVDKLYEFVNADWFKYSNTLRILSFPFVWFRKLCAMDAYYHYTRNKKNNHCKKRLLKILRKEVDRRTKRTYSKRSDNEIRHYYIRYEKYRAMRRYNKRMLGAIGAANDPIEYQKQVHGVLRRYISTIFRIDYNMRIYQLVERVLRMTLKTYLIVLVPLLVLTFFAGLLLGPAVFGMITFVTACWAASPLAIFCLRVIYTIIYGIFYLIRLISGNKIPLKYGAKDVESNRYGLVLDCFVCEQYKILAYAACLANAPRSTLERTKLLSVVNDYNKRIEDYSKLLRINIAEIEPTAFIDKLVSGKTYPLTELQNFYYVRELVQVNGEHDVGQRLDASEMSVIRERLNRYIGYVSYGKCGLSYDELLKFTDDLASFIAMMKQHGINPEARMLSDSIRTEMAGYEFISRENLTKYRNTLNKLSSNPTKRKRIKLAESLAELANEVATVREVISDDSVQRFKDNTRTILSERAKDTAGFTDEERFRIKEEIVSFIEKYPADKAMLREEVARDFIKFIDDVGGTPERVIITSLALDNMIY